MPHQPNPPALAGILLALFTVDGAVAQDDGTLDEIVVYGEKSAKTLQDTQASVAVITADDIVQRDIQSFRDAFRLFGNVIDADWADAGFVIRGVNSEGLTPGGQPLAAIYLDGAQQTVQGARRGGRGLWDVQQVEVYRGPQSTLSGRASLAGAIYVRSKDPTQEWDFRARITGGSDDNREGAIAFGGPINDILSFRIAAEYQSRESDLNYPGYERFVRFDNFIEDEYKNIRGKLLADFGDTRALLTISTAEDSPLYDDIAGPGLGFEYSERRGDLNASLPFFQENREADNDTASLEITHDMGGPLTFTSLTSYNQTDLEVPSINEGTPGEVFTTLGFDDQELITQEFRLNSDGERNWVAGFYYSQEDTTSFRRRSTFFGGGREDVSNQTFDLKNYALFGEINWPFARDWTAVVGGRIDRVETDADISFSRDNFNPEAADIFVTGRSEANETNFLPKVGVEWEFADDRSLGLTVQRGFRIGGAGVDSVDGTPFEFDAEYTWTTELAYRSVIADGRATLNANVFYTDWEDQQVEVQLVPGDFTSAVTLNAGESSLYGAELESQITFSDSLTGFVSLGLLNTEFDSFVSTAGDFTGLDFPESPDLTLAFGLDYNHNSGFFTGFDAKHVSEYLARDLQNAPVDEVGDYFVVNLRAGYRNDRWTLTVFADNAFDEEYFVYRDVIGDFDCCASLGLRRLTGATLTFNY
ncbi:MAG: TonB-dependent receptor [Pseudomonadota bacterium]